MAYWIWDSSLELGIDVIDNQHRRIVEYINDLATANRLQDKAQTFHVLMGLVDYTRTHFEFEENLFDKAGYPLSTPHKRVHDSFIARINQYVQRFEAGENIARSLEAELQIWMMNHIKHDDKDYAPHVKKIIQEGGFNDEKGEIAKKGWLGKMLGKFFA